METQAEIFAKVANMIHDQISIGKDKIKMESRFIEDLHCDSLDVAEIGMQIDEEFGTNLSEEQTNSRTVGDVVKLIETHLKK